MSSNIFKVKDLELPDNYEIQNQMIENIDLNFIVHYGVVSLQVNLKNRVLFSEYNLTMGCGWVIKFLTELFEIEEEDGLLLSEIKNIPCRIIVKDDYVIALGHYMKDKFVNINELMKSLNNKINT